MLLSEMFDNVPAIDIKQLSIDSRVPMKDCIFFCLSGIKDNGHDYIEEAIKNGASVIVYDKETDLSLDAIFINVDNVADCLNSVASKFYDYPAKQLETYITCGCDGCNSINYILRSLLNNIKPTASIGSGGIDYKDNHLMFNYPTMTILDNQKYLKTFLKEGIKACTFEANAQSLYYKKLDSVNPDVFIYTYTNQNSIEYKETGNKYLKIMLNHFYSLGDNTNIVLNRDDMYFDDFVKACGKNTFSYGFNEYSDYQILDVILKADESLFTIKTKNKKYKFNTKLLGMYNIYNCAAVLAALDIMGYDLQELGILLNFVEQYPGVMQSIKLGQKYNVLVDSAKNISIIDSILLFAKSVTKDENKIYVLYGINTNDDEDKIEDLCECISNYTNKVIFTENYTYNEDLIGFIEENKECFEKLNPIVIDNREIAIESIIELMNDDDTLLILGKGNETHIYRSMGKEQYLGDIEIAKKYIKKRLDEEDSIF